MAGAKWLRRCNVFLSRVASGEVRQRAGRQIMNYNPGNVDIFTNDSLAKLLSCTFFLPNNRPTQARVRRLRDAQSARCVTGLVTMGAAPLTWTPPRGLTRLSACKFARVCK